MSAPLIIVSIIAAIALLALSHAFKTQGTVPLVWRHLSGAAWHGKPLTDATWLQPATRRFPQASRFHHAPRAHRAGVRLLAWCALLGVPAGLWQDRPLTLACLAVTGLLAVLVAARGLYRAGRSWHHDRGLVRPLAVALGPLIGVSDQRARKAIAISPAFATVKEGEIGTITLPDRFHASPDQRKAVQHLVSSRLPVDVDHQWQTSGRPQRLTLLAAPECPSMVPFDDLVSEMAKCNPSEVVIGLDRHERVFRGSFNLDDPHWGFSVGSGRGKSTFLMLAIAQLLHQEAEADATGIDPKMTSFDPLVGVPGITIANDPRDMGTWDRETQRHAGGMWGAIDDWVEDMMNRLDILKNDPAARFPISVLMLDEVNQFSAMTAAIWRNIKAKDEPATPPIWMKIASGCWMGRAVRKHVVMVGQRLDDKATGGIGLRDSLGFRGLAGFRKEQWDMLIGTRPVPRSQKPKGRWIYSDGQTETWVQNICPSTDPVEAGLVIRDYAMAGRRAGVATGVATGSGHALSPAATTGVATATWVVGLDAGAAVLGLSADAFRQRRHRAGGTLPGEIRKGNQPAWTEADLAAFAAVDATAGQLAE